MADKAYKITQVTLQGGGRSSTGAFQIASLRVAIGPVTVEGMLDSWGSIYFQPEIRDDAMVDAITQEAQEMVLERLKDAFAGERTRKAAIRERRRSSS